MLRRYVGSVNRTDDQFENVVLERPVADGQVLGHNADGKVVLAEGGLPGEAVKLRITRNRKRLLMGVVQDVLEPAAGRVTPPCALVAEGCGGCDLQHADLELQQQLKVEVIRDSLAHLGRGRFSEIPITAGTTLGNGSGDLAPQQLRTTVRTGVIGARAGFRRRHSNDVLRVANCMVSHPAVNEVMDKGRFAEAEEVTIRVSVASGEVIVLVDPHASKSRVPDAVSMIGLNKLRAGKRLWMTETVGGHNFRISADSFFQASPRGAEELAGVVAAALGDFDPQIDRLADLYGGVGLFTVLLGAERSELVESSRSAVADARLNTKHLNTRIVRTAVERWRPSQFDAVVADPPRSGLGAEGADAVAATGAASVALVSCDPAAMGRDLGLLADRGYEPRGIQLVDMFPHTHHIEAVTSVVRV